MLDQFTPDIFTCSVISGQPGNEDAVNTKNYSLSLSASKGSETSVTLFCKINDGPWQSCGGGSTSTVSGSYSGSNSQEGSNTVQVYAAGASSQSSVATRSWIVDTVAPGAPTVSTPASPSESSSVSFSIIPGSDPSPSSGFYYNACTVTLPGGGTQYPSCGTSLSYAFSSGYGTYTFAFKTWDLARNQSPAVTRSVTYSETSLLDPPTIDLVQIDGRSASFHFTGQGSFECKVDSTPWESCTSPKKYSDLSYGDHTFYARGLFADKVSDSSSSSFKILKATLAKPQITSLLVFPKQKRARLTFKGKSGAVLQCQLNKSPWKRCFSPTVYRNLRPGKYTFRLRQKEGDTVSPASARSWNMPRSKKRESSFLMRAFLW